MEPRARARRSPPRCAAAPVAREARGKYLVRREQRRDRSIELRRVRRKNEQLQPIRVLPGSAPLQVARGPSESRAGRFEVVHLHYSSVAEMRSAFGSSRKQRVLFGGYPCATSIVYEDAGHTAGRGQRGETR